MKMIETNVDSLSVFINQLSSSLTILRNYGLIFGTRQYDEYSTKTFDVFNPNTLYFIISDTLFYKNKEIQYKIRKYQSLFENTSPIHTPLLSEDENLFFIQITPLGKNLGKCCCE